MGATEGTKVVAETGMGETTAKEDVDFVAKEETYKGSTIESSAQKWQGGEGGTCIVVGDDVLGDGSRAQGSKKFERPMSTIEVALEKKKKGKKCSSKRACRVIYVREVVVSKQRKPLCVEL